METTSGHISDSSENRDIECDFGNGLILSHHYLIPEEILGHILSFVDENSLAFNCRLVCRVWRDIVQNLALRVKAERKLKMNRGVAQSARLSWVDYYWILRKISTDYNMLKNNCGQDGLRYWNIISNCGHGWTVESTPRGTEVLPPINADGEPHPDFMGRKSCFATSFGQCSKEQLIKLDQEGLTDNIMDYLQPPIQISEWTACRVDCGSVYELEVCLLDENLQTVTCFKATEDFSDNLREIWHQVTHIFENYGPGVRYIRYYHAGSDSQFWAGYYGSKMSGGSVRAVMSKGTNSWDT